MSHVVPLWGNWLSRQTLTLKSQVRILAAELCTVRPAFEVTRIRWFPRQLTQE
jgi:hypothetical protein